MEDSHGLMDPKTVDGELRIAVEFIEDVDTLDNFADISHIEHIVRFCRSWKEVISDSIVEIDSRVG
jgi:hypothetical protein